MDIVVKGRKREVSDRFRQHAVEKLSRVERFDHRIIRLDVEVSEERNPRQSDHRERVEVTCVSKGPLIRAEAAAADPYAALDLVVDKLSERLRRAADRRRIHHGTRTPASVGAVTGAVNGDVATGEAATATTTAAAGATTATTASRNGSGPSGAAAGPATGEAADDVLAGAAADEELREIEAPWGAVVREKMFESPPISLDEAVLRMELLGHDFFLFPDADSGLPSVVYRRKGYDYGVIRLKSSTQEVA